MTAREHPFGHGRLAYVQIPALDVHASAAFYKDIFGWQIRGGSPAHLSFTDATGDIIGAFVTDRDDLDRARRRSSTSTCTASMPRSTRWSAAGSKVVRQPYLEGDVWVATLIDPAGNVIGIWQFDPR